MRKPTPEEVLYQWHRETLAHINSRGEANRNRPRVSEGDPQCGWFRRRLVAKGPFVPARIWCEQTVDPETGELTREEVLRCEVDGRRRDVVTEWTWLCGHPISEDDYMEMISGAFARFAPEPAATPTDKDQAAPESEPLTPHQPDPGPGEPLF